MAYTLTADHMDTMKRSARQTLNGMTSAQKRVRHQFGPRHVAQVAFDHATDTWHLVEIQGLEVVATHKLAACATGLERLAAHWAGFVATIEERRRAAAA